jgi:hypothetical protein
VIVIIVMFFVRKLCNISCGNIFCTQKKVTPTRPRRYRVLIAVGVIFSTNITFCKRVTFIRPNNYQESGCGQVQKMLLQEIFGQHSKKWSWPHPDSW